MLSSDSLSEDGHEIGTVFESPDLLPDGEGDGSGLWTLTSLGLQGGHLEDLKLELWRAAKAADEILNRAYTCVSVIVHSAQNEHKFATLLFTFEKLS